MGKTRAILGCVRVCVCHILISAHAKRPTHGVSSCSAWLISVVMSAFQKARALKETKKEGTRTHSGH